MKPVIVGVDPGTTTAYAVLDINGELLGIKSSKLLDLNSLIRETIQYGNPTLVGCDKNPKPKFVEKFSIKVGAKLIEPEQNLLQVEKKELVNVKTKNDHEFDAYASAMYAYNEYRELFAKIKNVLKKEKKSHLTNQVVYLVVREEMSIQKAIEYLETPAEEKVVPEKIKVKVVRPKKELDQTRKQLTLMKEKNASLKDELQRTEVEKKSLKKRIEKMPMEAYIKQKEIRIKSMSKQIKDKEKEKQNVHQDFHKLKKLMAENSDKVLVKKLRNLANKEFHRKRWLDIKEGDILLVEDPNVASKEVIDFLKNKVAVIIHRRKLSVRHKAFAYVNAADIKLKESKDFAFVNKDDVGKYLNANDVLRKVIIEYQKKRLHTT